MLFYRKYKNNNQHSKGYGKTYARAVVTETVGIEKIAQTMQDSCTVKRADVLAVLSELGPTITTLLQESKRVRIPYLGCFKLGIKTIGESDPEKFNARDNIDSVHVLFQPATEKAEQGKYVKSMVKGVVIAEEPSAKKKEEEEEEP